VPEYPPLTGGGIATYYGALVPPLLRQGHKVRVIAGSAFSPRLAGYQLPGLSVEFLEPTEVSASMRRFDRYRLMPELQRHLAAAWAAWERANGGAGFDVTETTDWGLLFIPWIVEESRHQFLCSYTGVSARSIFMIRTPPMRRRERTSAYSRTAYCVTPMGFRHAGVQMPTSG